MSGMRWLFWTLLLLNLVAAYWFGSSAEQRKENGGRAKITGAYQVLPDGVERLQLWRERSHPEAVVQVQPAAELAELDKEPPESALVEAEADRGEVCAILGPWRDQDATQAQVLLQSEQLGITVEEREEVVREDFWLIIPPLENEDETAELLQVLHGKGVESFLIAEGEYKNGITLGVFSERANTDKYQKNLLEQGVNATVVLRPKIERWLWLKLAEVENKESILSLLEREGLSANVELQWREGVSCEASD